MSLSFPCSFFPYRNFEDEIFVRWMECNTQFSRYVLRYIFRFFNRIFRFGFRIYFCFMISYITVLHRIWIRRVRVSLILNQGPDPSILIDLVFSVVRFNQFQFQILFSNILDFSWFSKIFLNYFTKSSKSVSIGIANRFSNFSL